MALLMDVLISDYENKNINGKFIKIHQKKTSTIIILKSNDV